MKGSGYKLSSLVGRSWYKWCLVLPILTLVVLMLVAVMLNYWYPDNAWILLFVTISFTVSTLYGFSLVIVVLGSMLRSVWHDPETSDGEDDAPRDEERHHSRNQAITVLSLATAALGFGVFNAKIEITGFSKFVPEGSIIT